jgi:hypothetical protein
MRPSPTQKAALTPTRPPQLAPAGPGLAATAAHVHKAEPAALIRDPAADRPRTIRHRPGKFTHWQPRRMEAARHQIERLPDPGEQIHIVQGGEFYFWDLIPTFLQMNGRPAAALAIATLSFNADHAKQLLELLDAGKIAHCDFICSTMSEKRDQAGCAQLAANLKARGHRYVAVRNHAKLILLTMPPDYYTLAGSANLGSCRAIETFTMTNHEPTHDFHRSWIDAVFSRAGQTTDGNAIGGTTDTLTPPP